MKKLISLMVTVLASAVLLGTAFAETWTWKGASGGNWASAGNWIAPDGTTTPYPNGPEADVVFPDLVAAGIIPNVGGTCTVYLETNNCQGVEVTVRSLTFTNYMAAAATSITRNQRSAPTIGRDGRGTLHIGAGGVRGVGATTTKNYPIFACNVVLDASQTWTFEMDTSYSTYNDTSVDLEFLRGLSCAADVEWNVKNCPGGIACYENLDASKFYGTLKTSARLFYKRNADPAKTFGNAKAIIHTNDASWGPGDGYGGSMTSSRSGLIADYANAAAQLTNAIPFNYQFDFSSTTSSDKWSAPLPWLVFNHIVNNAAADYHTLGYTTTVSRALSGKFASVLRICAGKNGQMRYGGLDNFGTVFFPDRQRTVFSGDNSGLVSTVNNGYIILQNIVAVAAHANAFGEGNAIPMKTEFANTYAAFTGLLATDGITINAPLSRNGSNDYWMLFGAADPNASCTFKGTITGSTVNPMRLTAPKGAKARFEGVISNVGNGIEKCLEIFGGGDVELAAANTFSATPYVRSGRLLLANDKAANGRKILLGGYLAGPDIHVKVWNKSSSFAGMTMSGKDTDGKTYASKGQQWYTANKSGKFSIQNVEIEEGDFVLQNGNPEFGENEGLYKAIYQNDTLVLTNQYELNVHYGRRIDVDDGTWKGEYLYFCRESNPARQHILEDIRNPNVAAMISKDGVSIASPIDVTANYSTGTSTIGMSCTGTGTFTGAITLNRDVTFEAVAGATLHIAGAVTDANGAVNAIAFAGLGSVVFDKPLDLTGRQINVAGITREQLDKLGVGKVVLATGSFTGTPVIPEDCGIKNWKLVLRGSSIALYRQNGVSFILQ